MPIQYKNQQESNAITSLMHAIKWVTNNFLMKGLQHIISSNLEKLIFKTVLFKHATWNY